MNGHLFERLLGAGAAIAGVALLSAAFMRLSEPLEMLAPLSGMRSIPPIVMVSHRRQHSVIRARRPSPVRFAAATAHRPVRSRPIRKVDVSPAAQRVARAVPTALRFARAVPVVSVMPRFIHASSRPRAKTLGVRSPKRIETGAMPEPPIGYDLQPELAVSVAAAPVAADLPPDSFRLHLPKHGRRGGAP
jgi:hypothetical protein